MNEEALREYLIEIGGLHLFEDVAEVISTFDSDGNGTLDEMEIEVKSQ
jgi:hypothetical protein